jgi:hypothetical protein
MLPKLLNLFVQNLCIVALLSNGLEENLAKKSKDCRLPTQAVFFPTVNAVNASIPTHQKMDN